MLDTDRAEGVNPMSTAYFLKQGKTWVREDSDKFYAEREEREAKKKMNPLWRFIKWLVFSA